MKKTRVQLPEPLYREVKGLAKQLTGLWPKCCAVGPSTWGSPILLQEEEGWTLPEPLDLGEPKIHYSRWRELANESHWGE